MASAASSPISFRNVVRYVQDVDANVKLYEAVGFKFQRKMGDVSLSIILSMLTNALVKMAILENESGLKLLLHAWQNKPEGTFLDTAIGFTINESVEAGSCVMFIVLARSFACTHVFVAAHMLRVYGCHLCNQQSGTTFLQSSSACAVVGTYT